MRSKFRHAISQIYGGKLFFFGGRGGWKRAKKQDLENENAGGWQLKVIKQTI
jgi:hypothetical protein